MEDEKVRESVKEPIIMETVVSEAELLNEKLEEPETTNTGTIVSMTEITEDKVSVNKTELVDDKLRALFIPKPMMDGEPILTEEKEESVADNLMTKESQSKLDPIPKLMMEVEPILTEEKEDSVSDNLMTKESRSKLYPIPKLMMDVESVLTEEKEGSVSDDIMIEESQVRSDPGEESAMKIRNVSGSKDMAAKNKDDGKADEEAAEDEVGAGETEENVEEVDSEDGESDIETSISKYSKSGVAQKRKTTSSDIRQLYEDRKEIKEETDEEKKDNESDDENEDFVLDIEKEAIFKFGVKSDETMDMSGDKFKIKASDGNETEEGNVMKRSGKDEDKIEIE